MEEDDLNAGAPLSSLFQPPAPTSSGGGGFWKGAGRFGTRALNALSNPNIMQGGRGNIFELARGFTNQGAEELAKTRELYQQNQALQGSTLGNQQEEQRQIAQYAKTHGDAYQQGFLQGAAHTSLMKGQAREANTAADTADYGLEQKQQADQYANAMMGAPNMGAAEGLAGLDVSKAHVGNLGDTGLASLIHAGASAQEAETGAAKEAGSSEKERQALVAHLLGNPYLSMLPPQAMAMLKQFISGNLGMPEVAGATVPLTEAEKAARVLDEQMRARKAAGRQSSVVPGTAAGPMSPVRNFIDRITGLTPKPQVVAQPTIAPSSIQSLLQGAPPAQGLPMIFQNAPSGAFPGVESLNPRSRAEFDDWVQSHQGEYQRAISVLKELLNRQR